MSGTISEKRGFPLAALLGQIYCRQSTGVLSVWHRSEPEPVFRFWFKRGLPCFSFAREGTYRLGDILGERRRSLVEAAARRQRAQVSSHVRCLLGQELLKESVITHLELQAALADQVNRRLMTASALSGASFGFDDGPGVFGEVPLSSPVVNPMETAARACLMAANSSVSDYLGARIVSTRIRLRGDRRLPAAISELLSAGVVEGLSCQEGLDSASVLDVPSRARTLMFLAAFGFLEGVPVPGASCSAQVQTSAGCGGVPTREGCLDLNRMERSDNHYALLGIGLDCTSSAIKQRYRELALELHPDRVGFELTARARALFARVVDAYHTLSRERLRTEYDCRLFAAGRWSSLGEAEEVLECIDRRCEFLERQGHLSLASEYERLRGLVVPHRPFIQPESLDIVWM